MPVSQRIESLHLIGVSDAMQQLYKVIGRICNADCAVLLIGEKGCGKSMVARSLHYYSHRAPYPFQIIDGAQVRETTDEELLGVDDSVASGATCYITSFSSMPSFVQHQLISIHRRKEYKCLHTGHMLKHNLRFIVANDGTIKEELESGKMPADLFYDWNFLTIQIPPLRDRKDDIPLLANHFLELHSAEMRISRKELSPEAVDILKSHDWPGNLDELKAVMRTALSNCRGNYIRAEHLPELHRLPASDAWPRLEIFLNSKLSNYIENTPITLSGNLYQLLLPQIEKSVFRYALKKTRGNKNRAAHFLGLHRNTLNKKIQNLG
jgi:two-component system, NtrC family, nitrogen regulation response regulator GlnG